MKRRLGQDSFHEDISRQHEVKRGSSRSVGFVFAGVFGIIALIPMIDGGSVRLWSAGIAVVLMAIAVVSPAYLDPLNRAWFRFGLALNAVVSPIVLGFLFYGVITPIGLLMRLSGKDPLRLASRDGDQSYWIDRSPPGPSPESMRHQF